MEDAPSRVRCTCETYIQRCVNLTAVSYGYKLGNFLVFWSPPMLQKVSEVGDLRWPMENFALGVTVRYPRALSDY